MMFAVYLTPLLLALAAASFSPKPSVVIDAGTVVGVATSLPSSRVTVNKFLGIPYAEPPVGSKRFLPPTPHAGFGKQPFHASQWGNMCYQQNKVVPYTPNENEDCLNLNVYAPAPCSSTKRPVLVWIYGGDLQFGTSGQEPLDGTTFAANHGIVVVTLNYRVNAFGFPNSPALPLTETNLGFLDQRLALDWVQKNIHSFGGDPHKVTIAGESSGASSVDRLVDTFAPPLVPPFRAAGLSSGQATVSAIDRNSGPASWAALSSALGCNNTSPQAELACMQATDALKIRSVVLDNNLDFSPVNDGVTQVELPYIDRRAAGHAARVPLYLGTSAQEGTILADTFGLDISSFSQDQLIQLLELFTGGNQTVVDELTSLIDSIMQTDGLTLFYAAAKLYTELVYQCPAKLVSQASVQSGLPVWRYYQNASFPNINPGGYTGSYPKLGAFHTADLQLIWGTYPTENATQGEVELSKTIQAAWAGFIKDPWRKGPGWDKVEANGSNLACFGCEGTKGITLIDEAKVDARCALYEGIYQTIKTPLF